MDSTLLNRVIVLVDMDCFYCQVEENLNPFLKGKPIAVVQYNQWRGGGIIAVNYPARNKGVTRHMRGQEAKQKCPDLELVSVPTSREKADLTKYRDAGKRVADVLQTYTELLERASVDEAYLDITRAVDERLESSKRITQAQLQNTHVVGSETGDFLHAFHNNEYYIESNLKLAMGGAIAEEIRSAVFEKTGYRCSAGIAHNKILAKLACGLHKPNQQTILPQDAVARLYEDLPVGKIRSLGGKFGNSLTEDLGIKTMAELEKFTRWELMQRYDEKTGTFLYNIARGVDLEPVTTRLVSKSIGCCKKFPGRQALTTLDDVDHWINELSLELSQRLEKDLEENNRKSKQMVVSFAQQIDKNDVSTTRTLTLRSYDKKKIADDTSQLIRKQCLRSDGSCRLKYLGISATKFESCNKTSPDISAYFSTTTKADEITSARKLSSSYSDETVDLNYGDELNFDENCWDVSADFAEEIFTDFGIKIDPKDAKNTNIVTNEASNDSITGELVSTDNSDDKATTLSYFSNYFKNLETKSSLKRNFDTSRYVSEACDGPTLSAVNEFEKIESVKSDCDVDKYVSPQSQIADKEFCDDCKKMIAKSEMISHKDYHYALQIVRDEAHIYKNIVAVEQHKKIDGKATKRKKIDDKSPKLTGFMRAIIADENFPTELCKDCNKRIRIEEVTSHMDYHAAKKLHMEINSVKSVNVHNFNVKNKRETKNNNLRSIASFFKPA